MTRTNRVSLACITACVLGLAGATQGAGQCLTMDFPTSTVVRELQIAVTYTNSIPADKRTFDQKGPFFFDGTILRQTLENYLDRAITMGYFLVPGQPEGYQFPYRDDDVRMIHNLVRQIYRAGHLPLGPGVQTRRSRVFGVCEKNGGSGAYRRSRSRLPRLPF